VTAAVETTRTGQLRLAVPDVPRQRYTTGQQEPCMACAAAGVDRLGVSRDGPGSPPLCMPCWRGRQQRQNRRERQQLVAAMWEGIGAAAAAAVCGACGAPEPVSDCWLCSWSWLAAADADAQRRIEAEQAEVQAAFARIRALTDAETRVAALRAWLERLSATVRAYHQPHGRSRGRAVELLADLLARDAAARGSRRGRPGALPHVSAVQAVDADWRSGRRSLPGRDRTAELAGCSVRAVSSAWARGEALHWCVRTRQGRRLTLAERIALGRSNDRAEWDITPLHHGDHACRAPFVPAALAVLGELIEHAQTLLRQAEEHLDELRARTGGYTEPAEHARRIQLRQAAARAQTAIVGPDAAPSLAANICTPRTAWIGECVSSCPYWGFAAPLSIMRHAAGCAARPHSGRWKDGASRSPTRSGADDLEGGSSQPLRRPRTDYRARRRSQHPTRPRWARWALDLARDLVTWWPWLAPAPRPLVMAVLGSRLGPRWTAAAVADVVHEWHGGELLAAPAVPVAYLRHLLDQALTGPDEPPYPARRHDEHRREQSRLRRERVESEAAALRARQATIRAELDTRDAAAATERAGAGVGRQAARAAAAQAAARRARTWPEVAQPGAGVAHLRPTPPPGPAGEGGPASDAASR
jgi:hypothetical protein